MDGTRDFARRAGRASAQARSEWRVVERRRIAESGGAGITITPGRSRTKRIIGGSLAALGSFALRFAVHYAGEASARDPKASFHLQRNRH